jgi:glutathione S-transferase
MYSCRYVTCSCPLHVFVRFHSHLPDLAHYGWVASAGWAGINIDEFPSLKAWEERMTARPGVEKGRHVPDPHTIKELLKDKAKMEEHAAKSRAWVQKGMKEDAAKKAEK